MKAHKKKSAQTPYPLYKIRCIHDSRSRTSLIITHVLTMSEEFVFGCPHSIRMEIFRVGEIHYEEPR